MTSVALALNSQGPRGALLNARPEMPKGGMFDQDGKGEWDWGPLLLWQSAQTHVAPPQQVVHALLEGLLGSLPSVSNCSITASDHARVLGPMGVGSGKSPADTQRHNVVR
jgi:hypothetical protein